MYEDLSDPVVYGMFLNRIDHLKRDNLLLEERISLLEEECERLKRFLAFNGVDVEAILVGTRYDH